MNPITVRKNIVYLRMNSSFYPFRCIVKAVKDYGRVCNISIQPRATHILLRIKPKNSGKNLKKIGQEFYNYVLALVKDNS